MGRLVRWAFVLPSVLLLSIACAEAGEGQLRGVGIDQRVNGTPLPADVPHVLPTIIRLTLDDLAFKSGAEASLRRLQELVGLYTSRNMRVVVTLGAIPTEATDLATWREFVSKAAEQGRGRVSAYQVGSLSSSPPPDPQRYAYLLKLAAVQLHAADGDALVLQGAVPSTAGDWLQQVWDNGVAAYVDGLALDGPDEQDGDEYRVRVHRMTSIVERQKANATVIIGPIHLPSGPPQAARAVVDGLLRSLGTAVQVTVFDGDVAALKAALGGSTGLVDLVARDLVVLDERQSGLTIRQAGVDVTATLAHRLLYGLADFDTYLVYWSSPGGAPLEVEVTVRGAPSPKLRDFLSAAPQDPTRIERKSQDRLVLDVPAANHPLVIDFNFGNASSVATSVEVRNALLPRVEDIIAGHQRAQATQDALLHNYIAHVRIEQHFHPSPADPAYNLITENRLFFDRGGTEWEELSFEFNGAKWTSNRPPFPLLQPEKVLSLPLDLRLNRDYVYKLSGVDTVNGRSAYVVRFDPADETHALYRGSVWIDRETFLRLKVQAVQTKPGAPVVSNEETQSFNPILDRDGRSIWLADRLTAKQVILIAGRSVLIEREVRLTDLVLNTSDFDQQRQSARDSNRVMYRDTDEGVRYLVKEGETRVVSKTLTTSVKALAVGTTVDPSFDYPLPLGGINILDFNFMHRNMQLALLYAGVLGVGNIQRANLWGGKFDVSVDFFGLAVKSNDDVFDEQGKKAGERVNRIPMSLGANIGYQLTAHQKIAAHHEFMYDAYFRDATTAPTFTIPSSTATNGDIVGYEYRRQGYSMLLNAAWYRRSTWDAWGSGDDFDPQARTYTKYDAGLSKDFTFNTFHTLHFNGTYFGGDRLDRFSMYQFGMFDATRMHGVPSAVRFARLGMFRGSYSFNIFDIYRVDLFVDHARGQDANTASPWQPITGTGVRLNLRTPRNTILQLDFGKSFLPRAYQGAGSMVFQVLLLKPL